MIVRRLARGIFVRVQSVLSLASRRLREMTAVSETSRCRGRLAPYCVGAGIDIGFGGDPIVPHAICIDLARPYARYLKHPQHLAGDARVLSWFSDCSLDFVYSSHVLEDFEDTFAVLSEWVRVLKVGGVLVLYLPDEQIYRAHCESKGRPPNVHHVHDHFSLDYITGLIERLENLTIIHSDPLVEKYSFELVAKKTTI